MVYVVGTKRLEGCCFPRHSAAQRRHLPSNVDGARDIFFKEKVKRNKKEKRRKREKKKRGKAVKGNSRKREKKKRRKREKEKGERGKEE